MIFIKCVKFSLSETNITQSDKYFLISNFLCSETLILLSLYFGFTYFLMCSFKSMLTTTNNITCSPSKGRSISFFYLLSDIDVKVVSCGLSIPVQRLICQIIQTTIINLSCLFFFNPNSIFMKHVPFSQKIIWYRFILV